MQIVNSMTQTHYWLGFNHVNGIGSNRLRGLWVYFGHDMEAAWHAEPDDLRNAGLDETTLHNFLTHREKFDTQHALQQVYDSGAWVCTMADERYPLLLSQIPDPPPILYVKGELLPSDDKALAIIGTRKATTYGKAVTERISIALANSGVTIVSGLAHGIDTAAHKFALKSGGRTLAVLGNGIDHVYPRENKKLAEEIVKYEQGAIITEYPLGTPPNAKHFPARNRIISGLSIGVLVVEAPEGSGALLTANSAADQGREVFAIPGNISSPNSRGTNRLIQDGAKLVMYPHDILDELAIQHQTTQTQQAVRAVAPTTDFEAQLLKVIELEARHVDEIAIELQLEVKDVSAALLMLKLKGLVDETSPMMYMAVQY